MCLILAGQMGILSKGFGVLLVLAWLFACVFYNGGSDSHSEQILEGIDGI